MIRAYSDVYLDLAMENLASMLNQAVNDLGFDIDSFFSLFIASGVAKAVSTGDYRYLSGMSGYEVMCEVLEKVGLSGRIKEPTYRFDKTEEYWTGWVFAYYQWWSALTFDEIFNLFRPSEVRKFYYPYHEMDLESVCDLFDIRCRKYTRLKNRRLRLDLTQSELAKESGVPVRTIQQYEQRVRDIGNARVDVVVRLAKALGTSAEYLLDNN